MMNVEKIYRDNPALIAYAEPEGKTEQLCREIFHWDKPLYTIDSNSNKNILSMAMPFIIMGNVGLNSFSTGEKRTKTSKI